MNRILNQMKLHANLANDRTHARMALVSSYDPNNYCCKVRIQPEDEETGWLPIATSAVGNGWGIYTPPAIGDMVEIRFQEGDPDSGYIGAIFYNDEDRPTAVESQEFYIIHKSGSALKFGNDGTVTLVSDGALNVTAPTTTIDSTVTVNGNVTVNGDIKGTNVTAVQGVADQNGLKSMASMRSTFNAHKHTANNTTPTTGM